MRAFEVDLGAFFRADFAQRENGAARMRENAVDGMVAREVLQSGAMGGAENDEGGIQLRCRGENLNAGIAVDDARFNRNACSVLVARFTREKFQLAEGGGVQAEARFGITHGWKNVQQNEASVLGCGDMAGKHCARARGLSQCGGVQDDLFAVPAAHREMSLGSHGVDREVNRAQHLLCNRTKEKFADLPPAPSA